jgi:hypothetical protein
MSKYRRAAKIDINQPEIVKTLRKHGVTVETNKDDILCGYNGRTIWVELKAPDVWKKDGGLKAGTFKDSQIGLLRTWKGEYFVKFNAEQILNIFGIGGEND